MGSGEEKPKHLFFFKKEKWPDGGGQGAPGGVGRGLHWQRPLRGRGARAGPRLGGWSRVPSPVPGGAGSRTPAPHRPPGRFSGVPVGQFRTF